MQIKTYKTTDKTLPAFDWTKLSAINTCPRWGLIRYDQHKKFPSSSRQMALEAGSACHEFFCALRLYQLGFVQGHIGHMNHHGNKLFGEARWGNMTISLGDYHEYKVGDWHTQALNFCLEAFYSTGFADNELDKRRTVSNLEAALVGYFDWWNLDGMKVYVQDENDPTCLVGVENSFDITVELEIEPRLFIDYIDTEYEVSAPVVKKFRLIGRIDGIHVNKANEIVTQENKTASRLSNSWSDAFNTSGQVTGYCIAGTTLTEVDCFNARVLGLQIPRPASGLDNLMIKDVRRDKEQVEQYFDWLLHTVELYEKYKDDPTNAPMYTHSCNRYFSTCSLMNLCTAGSKEERLSIMNDEMVIDEWSPLDDEDKQND